MGIVKPINTEYGVEATYWNIGALNKDYFSKSIEVTMYGFSSYQSRLDGAKPLSMGKIVLAGEDYIDTIERSEVYKKIKEKQEFVDSEDK